MIKEKKDYTNKCSYETVDLFEQEDIELEKSLEILYIIVLTRKRVQKCGDLICTDSLINCRVKNGAYRRQMQYVTLYI